MDNTGYSKGNVSLVNTAGFVNQILVDPSFTLEYVGLTELRMFLCLAFSRQVQRQNKFDLETPYWSIRPDCKHSERLQTPHNSKGMETEKRVIHSGPYCL